MAEGHAVRPDRIRRVSRTFITGEALDGTVLVSGIIVASGSHGGNPILVFWAVVSTVVVFWAAHVYAHTIAGRGNIAAPPSCRAIMMTVISRCR
ncbi:MAG TPA: hypothetical protein VHV31_15595 [Nitrolancea sp.]|nr:hypothetical protein [Nitrolancea sp.]